MLTVEATAEDLTIARWKTGEGRRNSRHDCTETARILTPISIYEVS